MRTCSPIYVDYGVVASRIGVVGQEAVAVIAIDEMPMLPPERLQLLHFSP